MNFCKKKIVSVLLVCAVMLSLPCVVALARGYIEVDKSCNVTVKVPAKWEDLQRADFEVELYRVGDVDSNCRFTPCQGYEAMGEMLEALDSNTTAEDWSKLADIAMSAKTGIADYSVTMSNGMGSISGIRTGLYLVYVQEVLTTGYSYNFTPYLMAAPYNEMAATGQGSDSWIYDDIIIELKAEQNERTGDLEIIKDLKTYNTSLGTPLFVFDVEATDDTGKVVFSDVISISFDRAGQRSAKVTGIPAGANVTVTEVYSGASYKSVASQSQTIVINADEIGAVTFSNDYDDSLVFGTGVVNHFEYDGQGWEWHQITDNQ